MKDPFQEYRKVKDMIASLEERKVELELEIFETLDDDGITNKSTPYGQYFIMGRKTWEYSSDLKDLQTELAKKKKVEELEGVATIKSDSRYLRLVLAKEINK